MNRSFFVFAAAFFLNVTSSQARSHFYDEIGRLLLTVSPAGDAIRYTYDSADNLTQIESLTLPSAPSNLTATRNTPQTAMLAWQDNANDEGGFLLMRRPSYNNAWMDVLILSPDVTSYTDTNLDPDTNYIYRLVALDSADSSLNSAYSNVAAAGGEGSEAFDISDPLIEGDKIEFSFKTIQGALYVLEASPTLEDDSWTTVNFATSPNTPATESSISGDEQVQQVYLNMPVDDRVFYRVTRK